MVAAHKRFSMPKNIELYVPILVGAVKNYEPGINYQRDDDGENISAKNPNYNELTAMYWAWKNLDVDVIGLEQYRRLLSESKKRKLDSELTKTQVEDLLKIAPIVLPKKRNYYIESNYSHYVHAHHREPLDETRKVILEKYPEYVRSFDQVMKSKKAHMFNMMIMKKKYFDAYAQWLFAILFEVENRIDTTDYSIQEARVFGYLSELLLDVWIDKNNISFCESRWEIIGNRHIVEKAYFFMARKFKINKKTHFE